MPPWVCGLLTGGANVCLLRLVMASRTSNVLRFCRPFPVSRWSWLMLIPVATMLGSLSCARRLVSTVINKLLVVSVYVAASS